MSPDEVADRAEAARRQVVVDEKFMEIDDKITDLQAAVKLNTEITEQIRDILTSFRVMGSIAKWLTAMGAFGVACWHAWQKVTGR